MTLSLSTDSLVWAQDKEGIQLVENLYKSMKPTIIKQRERQKNESLGFIHLTLEEQASRTLYGILMEALAMRDYIADHGYDQLLNA